MCYCFVLCASTNLQITSDSAHIKISRKENSHSWNRKHIIDHNIFFAMIYPSSIEDGSCLSYIHWSAYFHYQSNLFKCLKFICFFTLWSSHLIRWYNQSCSSTTTKKLISLNNLNRNYHWQSWDNLQNELKKNWHFSLLFFILFICVLFLWYSYEFLNVLFLHTNLQYTFMRIKEATVWPTAFTSDETLQRQKKWVKSMELVKMNVAKRLCNCVIVFQAILSSSFIHYICNDYFCSPVRPILSRPLFLASSTISFV